MKHILILLVLFSAQGLKAQKNFEGTIVYKVWAADTIDNGQLTLLFKGNKIRYEYKMDKNQEVEKQYFIIDFDSARIYDIFIEDKNFDSRKLYVQERRELPGEETILGYKTDLLVVNTSGAAAMLRSISEGEVKLFAARDLLFHIDPKFENNPETMLVHNGRIVLAATITMATPYVSDSEEEDEFKNPPPENFLYIEAVSIILGGLSLKQFQVPEGFTKKRNELIYADTIAIADSLVRVDSLYWQDLKEDTIRNDDNSTKVVPKNVTSGSLPLQPPPQTSKSKKDEGHLRRKN